MPSDLPATGEPRMSLAMASGKSRICKHGRALLVIELFQCHDEGGQAQWHGMVKSKVSLTCVEHWKECSNPDLGHMSCGGCCYENEEWTNILPREARWHESPDQHRAAQTTTAGPNGRAGRAGANGVEL